MTQHFADGEWWLDMTEEQESEAQSMTDLDANLEATWGPAAQHSEYRRGDQVRYLVGLQSFIGTILWVAAPRESHIEGHAPLALRYIVERLNWTGFPDVCYSCDILSLEGPQEPVLVRCEWCHKFHYAETARFCPSNPNRP